MIADLVLQDSPVEVLNLNTDRRRTLSEAYEEVVNYSQLRAIILGRIPENEWIEAYQHDYEQAVMMLDNLVNDLRIITGYRNITSTSNRFEVESMAQSFPSVTSRAEVLHQEIIEKFSARLKQLCSSLDFSNDEKKLIPFSRVSWGDHRDIAQFHHVSGDGTLAYAITFLNPSLRDIDDFSRSLPSFIQKHIEQLKQTTFNWHPRILDGLLVQKQLSLQVDFREVLKDHLTDGVKHLTAWLPDPALVVDLRDPFDSEVTQIAINFWQEGALAQTPWQRWWERYGELSGCIVCILMALVLFETASYKLLFVISFFLAVYGVIGVGLLSWLWRSPYVLDSEKK